MKRAGARPAPPVTEMDDHSGPAHTEPGDRAGEGSRTRRSIAAWLMLALIVFYKRCLSPVMPSVCRFYPTCSDYAREAISRHGARRGGWMALRRLLRCRPFGPKGYDPVE